MHGLGHKIWGSLSETQAISLFAVNRRPRAVAAGAANKYRQDSLLKHRPIIIELVIFGG
jgi:hypothetical protein